MLTYKTLKITDDNTLMWSIQNVQRNEKLWAMIFPVMKNVYEKLEIFPCWHIATRTMKRRLGAFLCSGKWLRCLNEETFFLLSKFSFLPTFATSNAFKTLSGSNFFTRLFCFCSRFAYENLFIIWRTHSSLVYLLKSIFHPFYYYGPQQRNRSAWWRLLKVFWRI